jgi:hypothetical protein
MELIIFEQLRHCSDRLRSHTHLSQNQMPLGGLPPIN